MAIRTEADGRERTYWGGETGTPEFYTVKDTLQAYLGENVFIGYDEVNDTFIIVSFTPDPPGWETIVTPAGTVQIYAGALTTFLIE